MLLLAEAGSEPRGVTVVITIRVHHWRFCSVDMENNVPYFKIMDKKGRWEKMALIVGIVKMAR